MAELGLERHPAAVSHSELTTGHDVTHLLSQINQSFKQSKADQILRLLQDQDRHQDKSDDDVELLQEYEKIREEKVVCDSDTLTDSSSISDIVETETVQNEMNGHVTNTVNDGGGDVTGYRSHRSRTSMGFHGGGDNEENDNVNFDTRDISIRPKSSYVRRRPKPCFETDSTFVNDNENVEPQKQRPSKSARPKSRLGRASVQRTERKIVMIEADSVNAEPTAPVKDEIVRGAVTNSDTFRDRNSITRQGRRISTRGAKTFCDNVDAPQSFDNECIDSSNIMDTRDGVTEIQPLVPAQVTSQSRENDVTISGPVRSYTHVSSFNQHSVPRSSNHQQPPQQQQFTPHRRTIVQARSEPQPSYQQQQQQYQPPADAPFARSDTLNSNATLRSSERRDNAPGYPLKRTNSNLGGYRPKNPETVASKPVERPDMRPSTRSRRLQRRYMPQAPPHMSNVRPTSESVILARQKTEKNLIKKQMDARPHSEKIIVNTQNKNILSVAENPTQGPQTYVTSKGGVTQASHVQSSGFRGYDPGNRLKSGAQPRDLHGTDLTLPRGQNNMVMGSRKTIAAMMKLPPLEASLAAKKKERGLTLAQRETCV